jgi:hypothetical protein
MTRIWRLAGALLIAHVVVLLAGYSLQRAPQFGDSPEKIVSTYREVNESTMYRGLFVVTVAWLILLAALTLVSAVLRRDSDAARGFAGLVATAGTVATAVTLAGGYATQGGAVYAAAHGWSPDVVAGITMVIKFADLAAMAAAGVAALAVGVAGLVTRALPGWTAWLSVVVGVVGMVSGADHTLLDTGNLIWLVWLVVLGVVLLRGPRKRVTIPAPEPVGVASGLS